MGADRKPKRPKPPLERDVEKAIITYMGYAGWHLLAKTSQGFRKEPGGTRITAGLPDCLFGSTKHQEILFVEVKRPKLGRVTPNQKAWHDLAKRCGARVIVADSAEAVAKYLMAEGLL